MISCSVNHMPNCGVRYELNGEESCQWIASCIWYSAYNVVHS